jgi:transposase
VRLRHTLIDDRGEWQQRIHAVLYHHGIRRPGIVLLTGEGRTWLEQAPLPETAREQISVGLGMIDALDAQLPPIDKELRAYARRQTGCKALMAHYGIGELTSVAILAELGDCRRFSSSRHAVRYVGLEHAASSREPAAATSAWTACKDRAAAPHFPQREPHPITIMSPAGSQPKGRRPR